MNKTDEIRFQQIYEAYGTLIYRYLYKLTLGNLMLTQDLFQDVWEALVINFDEAAYDRSEIHLKNWLMLVAHNKAVNHMNKKSSTREILSEQEEEICLPEYKVYESVLEKMMIEEYIKSLSRLEREVFLAKIHGLGYEKLARQEKKSVHALECIYSRAVKKLRKKKYAL